ncbi:MAG: hypothetical protein ACFFDT_09685 [Candidatus Hodarchaeota archaeon]
MRSREAILIFLAIIVATSVYVGYQYFSPSIDRTVEVDDNSLPDENNNVGPLVGAVSYDVDEPETFDEMIADLTQIGCETIINWTGGWHGRRGLSYSDALRLAKKANWVGVEPGEIGFTFWLDGDFWVWIMTPTTQQTSFEKIEIQSGICTYNSTATYWKISLTLKNTGTATSTLVSAFINDLEVMTYDYDNYVQASTSTSMNEGLTMASGNTKTINLYIDLGYSSLSSGTTINIKIHSAGDMDYIKLIELV